MKKSVFRITAFILILLAALKTADGVLRFKYGDGIYDLKKFYELQDDTVDVLILGSSHAFESFNTGILWDEYGMASFVLGGSVQPMWNTYYYLKEALKTQTPDVIVLEAYMTVFSAEHTSIIKNNYGLKWSADKVASLKTSSPKESWREFFPEYTQYHARYTDLEKDDFLRDRGDPRWKDWKGFGCNVVTTPIENTDVRGVTDTLELFHKTEQYYRATIELAKENDIPIVAVICPFPGITKDAQRFFNRAGQIAAEYDVPFVNCNLLLDEIGIDCGTDAADEDHLNYRGSRKLTRYIGRYLHERYEIPDRRNAEGYETWERDAASLRQIIYNQELTESGTMEEIAAMADNPHYWTFVSVDGYCDPAGASAFPVLRQFGIEKPLYGGLWYKTKEGIVWTSEMNDGELYIRMPRHDFHLKHVYTGTETPPENTVTIDLSLFKTVEDGVNVVIYDTLTERIVISCGVGLDQELVISADDD